MRRYKFYQRAVLDALWEQALTTAPDAPFLTDNRSRSFTTLETLTEILRKTPCGDELYYCWKQQYTRHMHATRISSDLSGTLSLREQEVLAKLASGATGKEIAHACGISLHTVNTHCEHIYEKLHVRNRTEAALFYRAAGNNS